MDNKPNRHSRSTRRKAPAAKVPVRNLQVEVPQDLLEKVVDAENWSKAIHFILDHRPSQPRTPTFDELGAVLQAVEEQISDGSSAVFSPEQRAGIGLQISGFRKRISLQQAAAGGPSRELIRDVKRLTKQIDAHIAKTHNFKL